MTHRRTRPPPALEDLVLLCEHGRVMDHTYEGAYHCPGSRAPTRQELIDILGIDIEAARDADEQKYGGDGLALSDEAIRCLVDGALGGGT